MHVPLIARVATGRPPPPGPPRLVLVTSPAAVSSAPDLARAIRGATVVAVGPATAAALRRIGVDRIHIGSGGGAAAVAELAPLLRVAGGPLWHVRGALTSRSVAGALARHGLSPEPWIVYETRPTPDAASRLRVAGDVDVVCFASGSAARAYAAAGGLPGARVAVIGGDTADAARRAGLEVHAVSARPDMPGLADAAVRALSGPSPG